jgi:enoyl-CoA hydratase/carnithine racemase
MKYEFMEIQEIDNCCRLTINRPDRKNALNSQMRRNLLHFLSLCEDRYRVVVLTGVGDSFCSGADLSEEEGPSLESGREYWELTRALYESRCIFIAAVNGYARGGGVSLVNACDIAIATPEATFGIPEVQYGIYAGISGPTTQLAVPRKLASRLLLMGEPISAEEAEHVYLINETIDRENLLERAHQIANKLIGFDAGALAKIKRGLNSVPFGADVRDDAVGLALQLNLEILESGAQ